MKVPLEETVYEEQIEQLRKIQKIFFEVNGSKAFNLTAQS